MSSDGQRLRVGTRSSQLALWQTDHVITRLRAAWPELEIERVPIKTLGDRVTDVPLPQIGDKGLFTRELEEGLYSGAIDLAVHSLKDLPTASPDGLALGAVLEREDPRDALVAASSVTLGTLPAGARVGTSSLRRRAQLLAARPDLALTDLRGNVPTRVGKVLDGTLDAAVLAVAGLRRLGLDSQIVERLEFTTMLPAPGQGAVAVQIRAGDRRLARLVAPLDHVATRLATCAERALLGTLEGGCHVPVGALAVLTGTRGLRLSGLVATLDGATLVRADGEAPVASDAEARALGEAVARDLLAKGAGAILEALGAEAPAAGGGDA